MSNRGAFYFFLIGTLISLAIFLGLTYDTHRQVGALTNADKLSDEVVAGKHVWQKKNCNECHTILGFGIYYAPDLTKAYKRLGASGIKAAVLRPEEIYANSFRKMANLGVTEAEADQLVAFLEWVSNIDNHDWPPQDKEDALSASQRRLTGAMGLSRGAAAFQDDCMGCHSIGGAGGSSGGPLDNVADKYEREIIERYIENPQSVNAASRMPKLDLSDEDRRAVAEFLAGL